MCLPFPVGEEYFYHNHNIESKLSPRTGSCIYPYQAWISHTYSSFFLFQMLIDEKPCWIMLLRWDKANRVPCLKKERPGALHVAKGGCVLHQIPASTVSCSLLDLHCSRISFDCSILFWTFFSLFFPIPLPLLPFDFFFFRINENVLSYWSISVLSLLCLHPHLASQRKVIVLGRKIGMNKSLWYLVRAW